jgi:predicted RNase H-like HicB family nuclease
MTEITVEIISDPELGGFTARVPDIPVYGEGDTEDAAVADLKLALTGYIETFGLDDALSRVVAPTLRKTTWNLAELARG